MVDRLEISVAHEGSAAVLTVTGDIDVANVEPFRRALFQPAGEGRLVVDVNAVSYLDSAGIAALFERAKKGPLEVLASPGCPVRRVLEVVAIDRLATLTPSR
jgi:anti-anti-sigma factor